MAPDTTLRTHLSRLLDRYRYRLVLGGALVLYFLLQHRTGFTLFEIFYRWSNTYRWLRLDELFSFAIVAAGALALASWWSWHAGQRAEKGRHTSEARYRTLVKQLPAAFYTNPIGNEAEPRYISPYIATLTGYTPHEWLDEQQHGGALLHPDDRARVLAAGAHSAATGEPFREEYRLIRKDGTIVWVRDEALIVRDAPEGPPRWQGFIRDITTRIQAEEALRASEARYRQMFEGNRAIQLVLDPATGAIVDANPAACAFYGHTREALTALTIADLNTLPAEVIASELAAAISEDRGNFLFRHRCASGAIRDVEVHSSPISWHGRQLLFSIIHDITERRALEGRLQHQATHDALTGRPNRVHLLEHLGQALIRAEQTGRPCAVLFLDLDRFKHINDSLGHAAGDALLVAVAARLAGVLRAGDTLARLGGDEFVALLTDLADEEEATRSAARLHAALEEPFAVLGHDLVATTSVGLVIARGVADTPEELLRFADVALYRAKASGRSRTATMPRRWGPGRSVAWGWSTTCAGRWRAANCSCTISRKYIC